MVLKQIDLQNFRLHRSTSIVFSDNLNLIIGGNGQGKTSILEAIYYLCTTKNLNFASESDVVTFCEQSFNTEGLFGDLTENNARLYYDSIKNKKNYFLDGKQIFSSADVIGKFPVVTLIQSDHAITLGAPSDRRRFIDSIISQSSHTYLEILLEYNKILRQRSSVLSQIKEYRNSANIEQLDIWTDSLINNGTEIIKHRLNFVEEFRNYVNQAYIQIINNDEVPSIEYSSIQEISLENVRERFVQELYAAREDEIRRGVNLIGPHRDDYIFYINNNELKRFGSQGQHKTFQIALRFAQFFYIKEKLGRTPIFLMDDVFGELDTYRAGKISNFLSKVGQAFITMTDFTRVDELKNLGNSKKIKVENGTAAYI
ncbi:MAG: DNA replication and repair protein RecF [Ignavibacteria bacterium]|nr:DNA replication and repair protein RecF [Ignavibacteria bacterium]